MLEEKLNANYMRLKKHDCKYLSNSCRFVLPESNVRPNSAESGSDIDSQVRIFVERNDVTRET